MEAKNHMDDRLTRYLFNESGPEERAVITAWINKSRENQLYFEGLKKTFELLTEHDSISRINVEAEWNHLQEALSAGASPVQSGEETAMTDSIHNRPKGSRGWKVYRLIIPAAVAASLLVLVLANNLFHTGGNGVLPKPPVNPVVLSNPDNAVMHHERNGSGSVKTFTLPDGSRVKLSGSSELTYSEAAGAHRRDVLLSGEADFEVVKDKTKPFTVVSGALSTMAVGTRFTVTSFETEKFIQVKLMEGKVLVRSEKMGNNQQTGGFYLLPGQKLIYDKSRETVKVRSFREGEKKVAVRDKTINDNPLLPDYNKKSWFMFNNQSLDEIFHALEFMYDVKILYTKKDVDQRYFVGTFSKSDSVESILHQIAVLNKLTVTRNENIYTIEKK